MAAKQSPTLAVLRSDLALTRYTGTAGAAPLPAADSWGTLDLQVRPGGQGGLRQSAGSRDAGTVAGRDNLGQALIVRLLTPRGALAPLGHPEFGSRLAELIGGTNDETTRRLARLFTLEALAAEPRVARVVDLAVTSDALDPSMLHIDFAVLPLDDDAPLALALEVGL